MKTPHLHMTAHLRRSAIAGVLMFVALALQPATAQTDAPPAAFVLGTPEMKPDGQGSAHIYINDAYGQKRIDLKPADLVVRFGGQPAAGVRVQPDNNVPLQVVLGLDVSLWNPRDANYTAALTNTVLAAKTFVENIPNASFVAFPFSMTLPSPASGDPSWLQHPHLWQGNRTALFAAVDAAAKQFAGHDTAKGRKVIVLITNSGNTLSTSTPARGGFANTPASAISNTQQANAQVFVFAAEEKAHMLSEQRRAELRALVKATGGEVAVISAGDVAQLPVTVTKTLAGLQAGYRIDFTSTVSVGIDSELEIGLTPAMLSRADVGAQPALTASFNLPNAFLSPSGVVKLNIDQAWAKDIRRANVFINDKHVITLLPSRLEFVWGEPTIKESIAALKPGEQAVLTATVEYGLNEVAVMKAPVTMPALSPLTMGVTSAGQPADLLADQAYTLTAQGKNIRDVTFAIDDARGSQTLRAGDPHAPTRVTLPAGSYTLQARAVDEWGRPVQSAFIKQDVPFRIPPLAIASSLLLIVALIAVLLAMLQRRRAAGRVESTYRLVNYGNAEMEFVVLADYNASDFILRLMRIEEMDDAPAQPALPNAEDKLQLLTPPIPPQESVLLHVTIEPMRVRRLKQYDFRLVAYARSQDPAQPEVRAFTLRPLKQIAAPEQPV